MKRFLLCTAVALAAVTTAQPQSAHDHADGWAPLPASGDTIGTGSTDEHPALYYLTGDTRLEADLVIADSAAVTLCLNGYQLTGTGQNPVIRVRSARLTVCDCREGSDAPECQHPYYKNGEGLFVFDDGTDEWDSQHAAAEDTGVIAGGVITGGWSEGPDSIYCCGGGIDLRWGSLTLESGTIAGNRANSAINTEYTGGGGISLYEGETVINGGQVAGNTSAARGGGIYAAGSLTLNGGRIWGNQAYQGGGIFTSSQAGVVVMNGGEVADNTADRDGGGVMAYLLSRFTLNDGLIAGNMADGNGGGLYASQTTSCSLNGGVVMNNNGLFGSGVMVAAGDFFTVTGGIIADNVTPPEYQLWGTGNIYIGRYTGTFMGLSVTGGYIGSIEVNGTFGNHIIEGGFFGETPAADLLAEGCITVPVGEGVAGYREGFAHAVYKPDTATAGIVPDFVPGSPVYDRAPIEEGIDFTAGGVPDSLHVLYAHRTDTAAPLAYGLPTDTGTYHITATLLHNDNRRHYGQTPFDITIAKAEWDGERNAEGTVAAGHSDSLALPAIPEGAYYGTPSGDPRILDLRIADGYLHYTGGSGIEPGGSYTLVVPVGEGVNYHIYAIVVQLTGFGTSGVPSADGPSLRITTTGGQLHIAGSDERATVYDLHGRQVYQGFDRTIGLPEGVYMVRVGSEGRKVIVHP